MFGHKKVQIERDTGQIRLVIGKYKEVYISSYEIHALSVDEFDFFYY